MSTTFGDILGASTTEIVPPALVPPGQWLVRGAGVTTKEVTYEDKQTGDPVNAKIFTFRLEPLEAGAGVDAEQVAAGEYEGKSIFYTAFVPMKSNGKPNFGRAKGLQNFLEAFGLTLESPESDFRGAMATGQVAIAMRKDRRDGKERAENEIKDLEPASTFVAA